MPARPALRAAAHLRALRARLLLRGASPRRRYLRLSLRRATRRYNLAEESLITRVDVAFARQPESQSPQAPQLSASQGRGLKVSTAKNRFAPPVAYRVYA